MASANKIPTTRLLALVALFVASGVLCLRAFDLFVDGPPKATFTNAAEQSLTNILEPVIGEGAVRVSVSGEAERTIIVLLDQSRLQPGLVETVETITANTFGDAASKITITPIAFAAGTQPTLSPLQLTELISLSLLCLVLTTMLIVPPQQPVTQRAEPNTSQRAARNEGLRLVTAGTAPVQDAEIDRAAKLAASDPDGTAQLIRSWIGASGETQR